MFMDTSDPIEACPAAGQLGHPRPPPAPFPSPAGLLAGAAPLPPALSPWKKSFCTHLMGGMDPGTKVEKPLLAPRRQLGRNEERGRAGVLGRAMPGTPRDSPGRGRDPPRGQGNVRFTCLNFPQFSLPSPQPRRAFVFPDGLFPFNLSHPSGGARTGAGCRVGGRGARSGCHNSRVGATSSIDSLSPPRPGPAAPLPPSPSSPRGSGPLWVIAQLGGPRMDGGSLARTEGLAALMASTGHTVSRPRSRRGVGDPRKAPPA